MNSFNWPVVGHAKIQQLLQKSLVNNKLAHAYLFSGPVHLGKSLLAKQFIASILCNDYQQQTQAAAKSLPCGSCVFCQQFDKNIHPDVYYLNREEEKKNISVEQVRDMQKFLSLSSFLNSYKIALIADAQDLSESAQNALLKILEEPHPKTILILIANDYNFLLPTIVSRCQLIKFRNLSADEIFHHLISLDSSREQAKILTALSNGRIGLAIDYLQIPELYNSYINKLDDTLDLFEQDLVSRFKNMENVYQQAKNSPEDSDSIKSVLNFWQLVFRDILLAKNNLNNKLVNIYAADKMEKIAARYTTREVLDLMTMTDQIKKYLNYNINPRLAVENLLINL